MVEPEHNMELCDPPSMVELKNVIFALNKDASAGTDGYTARFYQASWNFINEDLLEATEDFLNGATLPLGISATSLALFLKPVVQHVGLNTDPLACAISPTR